MIAIPPDVAMAAHKIESITGPTVVFTNRGLSERVRQNADSVEELMMNLMIDDFQKLWQERTVNVEPLNDE